MTLLAAFAQGVHVGVLTEQQVVFCWDLLAFRQLPVVDLPVDGRLEEPRLQSPSFGVGDQAEVLEVDFSHRGKDRGLDPPQSGEAQGAQRRVREARAPEVVWLSSLQRARMWWGFEKAFWWKVVRPLRLSLCGALGLPHSSSNPFTTRSIPCFSSR